MTLYVTCMSEKKIPKKEGSFASLPSFFLGFFFHRGHCSSIDGVLAYINVPQSNLGFQIKKDVRTPDRSTPPRQSV